MKKIVVKAEITATPGIKIFWKDGEETFYPAKFLRCACRCALCVDEWTHEIKLKAEDIPEDITVLEYSWIGRYGIQLHWSDGHNAGIYTYKLLEKLIEQVDK